MILDDFTDVSGWLPVASGLARLDIASEVGARGTAMRLDFDFGEGGGFVVARKPLAFAVPETWALRFALRGHGPSNRLEIKLADPSGRNVWWYRQEAFALPEAWGDMLIRSRDIEYAWGPAGGGALTDVGAVEIALAAGPGGRGSIWIADLRLDDLTPRTRPIVRASSAEADHAPDGLCDQPPVTSWRSVGDDPAWVTVDFGSEREYGGLVIDWEPDGRAERFAVATSADGAAWTTVHVTTHADAGRSYVYMPKTAARHLRLALEASVAGNGFGIAALEFRPFELSRSIQTFFHGVAADAPRGAYPRWLVGEQTYWTPIGLPDGETCALQNEEGMVEVDRGAFSLEPFLYAGGRLFTWADVEVVQELADGALPIPSSVWRAGDLTLRTSACALRSAGRPTLFVRYRVENGAAPCHVRLFVAIRPFQVDPPWQAFGALGGVSPITDLDGGEGVVRIRGGVGVGAEGDGRTPATRVVMPLDAPAAFGAATFDQGNVAATLATGAVPPRVAVADTFGYAAGALAFDVELERGASRDVFLAIPFGALAEGAPVPTIDIGGGDAFARAIRLWREKLARPAVTLAPGFQTWADAARTAVAHVLVERSGPALQPGPRRYTRAWIRDGAIMAASLLRAGASAEALEFVRWYAGFQAADGTVPCAVDAKGADWLVEHDSHGELVFAVAECVRFTGDRAFLDELWPAVTRALAHLETLRATRLGPVYETPEKRAFRGLLPESASHEGYLAQPVHAYWDDFWAVRAFGDAAYLADIRRDPEEAARFLRARDAWRASLRDSIAATIAARKIAYVPGSVEWADFDPTATANAVGLLGEAAIFPPDVLAATFAEYLAGFRRRRDHTIDWNNYSAYEVRIIGALVHLGERVSAAELAAFLLGDRRPPAWNQWPEISWKDPRSPGHIGDVPHAWIGAEYALSFRSMLAYERLGDDALVLAAGIPDAWLDAGDVAVEALPTYWGSLGFTLRRAGTEALALSLRGDLAIPRGGIVIRPPLPAPLVAVEVDGRRHAHFTAEGVTVRGCPAEVVMRYRRA